MRRVSDKVKDRTLVITVVPCGLMGIACFASLLFGVAFNWAYAADVAVTLVCAIICWFLLGFCTFTVMEFWPSEK